MWSNGGANLSLSLSSGVFDFNSLWIYGQHGTFGSDANITARGFLNGVEIYSSTVAISDSYSLVTLNFLGIDSISISDGPGDFNLVIDDITVNQAPSVPEGFSSVGLLGLALVGLVAFRRRFTRA